MQLTLFFACRSCGPQRRKANFSVGTGHIIITKVMVRVWVIGHRSFVDASWNADATVNSSVYVLLCGDYLPSVKGYYQLLIPARTPTLQ